MILKNSRQLQHRIESATNSSYGARCQLLQNELLNIKIAHFQDEITIQHKFLSEIDKVAREMKEVPENKMVNLLSFSRLLIFRWPHCILFYTILMIVLCQQMSECR